MRPGQEFLLVAWHLNYQERLVGYSDFRLFLHLFDNKGSLVYSEVLDSVYGATDQYVAVVPADADGAALLFVAEGTIVWRYAARLVEG